MINTLNTSGQKLPMKKVESSSTHEYQAHLKRMTSKTRHLLLKCSTLLPVEEAMAKIATDD